MFAQHLYNIVYSLCYSTYNIFYTCIGLAKKYLILEICFSNVLTNNWLIIQDIRSYKYLRSTCKSTSATKECIIEMINIDR